MIDDLKPYLSYKDSGVPWLGQMPVHWEVLRARYLFQEVDERSKTGEELHLSMSQKLGLVPSSMVEQQTLVSESHIGGKLCLDGDIVLNRLKAHLGVFALARQSGVISPDYTVLRPICPLIPSYFEHVLRSPACRQELRMRAKGIVEGFWRLYTDDLYDIRLPVPPALEQSAIVRFLDHADRRIRRYIRTKKKLIALLNEQKQAIIHRAMTRGLDLNVPLKPSGVEWLGEVPEHWDIRRIASLSPKIANGWVGPTREILQDSGVPYIQSLHIKSGSFRFERKFFVSRDWLQAHPKICLKCGDVVVVQTGDIGQVACVPREFDGAGCHALIIIRTDTQVMSGPFLDLVLRSRYGYESLRSIQTGALHPHLNCTWVREIFVPVPPLAEQEKLLVYVAEETASLDRALLGIEGQLNLLSELRTRLIADVVTGKLDVREAAARLPDETEEPEPLDEGEAMGEDEAEGEGVGLDALSEEAIA